MLQRCTLAASPAAVLCPAPRGGVAPAALLQKRRSRAAVCSAERPLLSGIAARQHAHVGRLRSVPPFWTQQRMHPWYASSVAYPLQQRCRANAIMRMTYDEEVADDFDVLVAEQEPSVTANVPRGALATYCRLLRSQPLGTRDGAIVVPVSGTQLIVLAAWLNRDPEALRYGTVVQEACAAAKALDNGAGQNSCQVATPRSCCCTSRGVSCFTTQSEKARCRKPEWTRAYVSRGCSLSMSEHARSPPRHSFRSEQVGDMCAQHAKSRGQVAARMAPPRGAARRRARGAGAPR